MMFVREWRERRWMGTAEVVAERCCTDWTESMLAPASDGTRHLAET